MRSIYSSIVFLTLSVAGISAKADTPLSPLRVQGDAFIDSAGRPVRFWGVNLVAPYPSHAEAENLAKNLAAFQVNLVRAHHLLRPSGDWVTRAPGVVALQQMADTTRRANPEAWDRFDYLNAQLKKNGIYLQLPIQGSRTYLPGDVDVLTTDDADRAAWVAAMQELNSWDWKKAIDPRKMLPVIDERAAALNEEFTRQLLLHVNPHTGVAYGKDPQVFTIELLNEFSSEYTIVCNNRFPDYWQKKLESRWQAFAKSNGVEGGDLYKPATPQLNELRAKFLRKLDEDYLARLRAVIRETGTTAAVTFSNLWRGDFALQMHAQSADFIEDHMYADPFVVRQADDLFAKLARSRIAGKPYIVGEFNESEGAAAIKREAPTRTMLPLAAASYGSFQGWSGVVWFAWLHGDRALGADGQSLQPSRDASLGEMISDEMMGDHLRTAGMMFRRAMVSPSVEPITLHVDEPLIANGYNGLMRGKYVPRSGWHAIHALQKAFGPAPESQSQAPWMKEAPPEVLVSDTKEIRKDTKRQQLTVSTPMAEAFSGMLDGQPPEGLKRLRIAGESGFATLIVVAADGKPIEQSSHLIISRTGLDAANREIDGPVVAISGLQQSAGRAWSVKVTRPRAADSTALTPGENGEWRLPNGGWHECELECR